MFLNDRIAIYSRRRCKCWSHSQQTTWDCLFSHVCVAVGPLVSLLCFSLWRSCIVCFLKLYTRSPLGFCFPKPLVAEVVNPSLVTKTSIISGVPCVEQWWPKRSSPCLCHCSYLQHDRNLLWTSLSFHRCGSCHYWEGRSKTRHTVGLVLNRRMETGGGCRNYWRSYR